MKINITGIITEETRKQIRDEVLGQAKAIARETINSTVLAEIKRAVAALMNRVAGPDWKLSKLIQGEIRVVIQAHWSEINPMIRDEIKKAADEAMAEKMKAKTVWDAKGQHDYVQKMVQAEIRKALKKLGS